MEHSKKDLCFVELSAIAEGYSIPTRFSSPFNLSPHPLAIEAASQLQSRLKNYFAGKHNFGLDQAADLPVIGKMFGVLVVEFEGKVGYLSAFSGKVASTNDHPGFVPPIFNLLASDGFLNEGMEELGRMGTQIEELENQDEAPNLPEIKALKLARKNHSIQLQNKIFDHYELLNCQGDTKNIRSIFQSLGHKNPPSGAGECAGPKLLQYAFTHNMKPLAMAEFWWGASPKSVFWKHRNFYPSCKEKCEPILGFMLQGIEVVE